MNEAAYQAAVQAAISDRANKAFGWMIDALSQEGSGVLYEGNPRRSSTIDEMPAPQSEALLHSISAERVDYRTVAVGSFSSRNAEGFEHAVELESRPPSAGGRAFIEMAVADRDLHDAMRKP